MELWGAVLRKAAAQVRRRPDREGDKLTNVLVNLYGKQRLQQDLETTGQWLRFLVSTNGQLQQNGTNARGAVGNCLVKGGCTGVSKTGQRETNQ